MLAFSEDLMGGISDSGGLSLHAHAVKHHAATKKEGSGVGNVHALDIGGGSVDGLVDLAVEADVSGGGKSQTSDKSGAQIAHDVSVQVGHNHDVHLARILDQLHADGVDLLLGVIDVGVAFRHLAADFYEATVSLLHDSCLMGADDVLAA